MKKTIVGWMVFWALGGCGVSPYVSSGKGIQSLAQQVERQATRSNHMVRWNPGVCDCPPYELRLSDRWTRVILQQSGEQLPPEPTSKTEAYSVQGDCSPLLYPCGDTQICPRIVVEPSALTEEEEQPSTP